MGVEPTVGGFVVESELRGGHVGLKLGQEVGHERAWLHDAVEVLVAGEEAVDEHDEHLPSNPLA